MRSDTVTEWRLYNSEFEEFSVYTHSSVASHTRLRGVHGVSGGKRLATTVMCGTNRMTVIYEVIIIINVIIAM